MRARRPRRTLRLHLGGQALVEFSVVFPVFILMSVGSLLIFSWQLQIDSAQFAAEEGIQTAAVPTSVIGVNGLLCSAAQRALNAATSESFLRTTPSVGGTTGTNCAAGVPDYKASCPGNAAGTATVASSGTSASPTSANMKALLGVTLASAATPNANNVILVCAYCYDTTTSTACNTMAVNPAAKDSIDLIVSVVGYKPVFTRVVPFIGDRELYYGQNEQQLQQFE